MNNRSQYLLNIIQQNDGCAPNNLLPKHKKMALSPFLFYRGTAPLFYADVASGNLPIDDEFKALPPVYVMGDCHTSNFGFFSEEGSHGESVIFAPNDFDDACMGHAIWDLLRYCSALSLCRTHCLKAIDCAQKPVISEQNVIDAMHAFLATYEQTCRDILRQPELLYFSVDRIPEQQKLAKFFTKAQKRAVGGSDFELKSSLAKMTTLASGTPQFIADENKFRRVSKQQKMALLHAFSPYMDDAVFDVVARINAGTGSVGLDRFYFLVGPNYGCEKHKLAHFHIVEVKQQQTASPLRFNLHDHAVNRLNPAHLTARCQRHMQRRPDLLLDEVLWNDKHWLVRSRHHAKVGLAPEDIAMGKKNVEQNGFVFYAQQCGRALALAHCRSDRRAFIFEQHIAHLLHNKNALIVSRSQDYARQVEADYAWFCESAAL